MLCSLTARYAHLNFSEQISTNRRFACVVIFFVPKYFVLSDALLGVMFVQYGVVSCSVPCCSVFVPCCVVLCYVCAFVHVAARASSMYSDFDIDIEETRAGSEFRTRLDGSAVKRR